MKALILIFALFVSCRPNNSNNVQTNLILKPDSTKVNIDFVEFCLNFGKALQNNDTIVLEKILDTTIQILGREDNDPTFELKGHTRILKVREIYLSSGIFDYENDSNITYSELFANKEWLNKMYRFGDSNQDVEDFFFEMREVGVWKLKGIYTNTKSVK
jgi:hypothetical protein